MSTLDDVAAATEARQAAQDAAIAADDAWRATIRAAVADGQRVTRIAAAAGITRDRVYQIRDGRR